LTKKPIVVTGMAKTGSTWAGRTLAYSDKVHYIHEAFSHAILFNRDFRLFYNDVSLFNEKEQQQFIKYMRQYKKKEYLRLFTEIKRIILNKKNKYQRNRNLFALRDIFTYFNFKKRSLYKEPAAIFSSEFLSEHLGARIIILIRHPAAVIGSMKAHNMNFNFSVFKEREMYAAPYLEPFKREIEFIINKENGDIIEKGILIWNIVNHRIVQYQKNHKDWYFIRHEDLSLNALNEFEKIYKFLDLPFSERIRKRILFDTQKKKDSIHTIKKGGSPFSIRDSKENIKYWKKRLTEDEIRKIQEKTSTIWKHFYSSSDWY